MKYGLLIIVPQPRKQQDIPGDAMEKVAIFSIDGETLRPIEEEPTKINDYLVNMMHNG